MSATVEDFVKFVGRQEAIELSRVDDPGIDSIRRDIIENGLAEAREILLSDVSENWTQFKSCQVRIARYLLDPYSGREIVKQGYLDAMERVAKRNRVLAWV